MLLWPWPLLVLVPPPLAIALSPAWPRGMPAREER